MNTNIEFDLNKLRILEGGRAHSFEELCCQLFHFDPDAKTPSKYRRIEGSGGDDGVEAVRIFENGEIWGCQVKFIHKFDNNLLNKIENSLCKAIIHYTSLTKYIICVPENLTSFSSSKESERYGQWQKLNNRIDSLTDKYPQLKNLKVKIWDKSELRERFIKVNSEGGFSFYWFNENQFSSDWFQNQILDAKSQAGLRYLPDIHVNTNLGQNFESFGCTANWREHLLSLAKEFLKTSDNWYEVTTDDKELVKFLANKIEIDVSQIRKKIKLIHQNLVDSTREPRLLTYFEDEDNLTDLSLELFLIASETRDYLLSVYGKDADSEYFRNYAASNLLSFPMEPLQQIRDLIQKYDEILTYSSGLEFKLPTTNLFLISGDAGVGKTHGILDIAHQRFNQGLLSLVFFGEKFVDQDPWTSVLNELGLTGTISTEQFRISLNAAGEVSGYPLLLFIDALNETPDHGKWNQWLPKLEKQISKYPYLKLCFTCRENYIQRVIPPSMKICKFEHKGFLGVETEAQKAYAQHFEIENPPGIYFHKIFSNPLFLRIFYEALSGGNFKFPFDSLGINAIISIWLNQKKYRTR